MQTKYASGRASLPAPVITASTGGAISGANGTYYFWIKARNRVGYNSPSSVATRAIANAGRITIDATNFVRLPYEDWTHFIVSVSRTNTYSSSRVLCKVNVYTDNTQTVLNTPSNVVISDNFYLNGVGGSVDIANPSGLPSSSVPNGFRVYLTSTARHYEFVKGSNLPIDNLSILQGSGGQWIAVNGLTELDTNSEKELYQVNDSELIEAPLSSLFQTGVGVGYYIINNEVSPSQLLELDLNSYVSDPSLKVTYNVKVIGYLNLNNFTLDTTGIQYVNTTVSYPETKVSLTKPLPSNNALVIQVTPSIVLESAIIKGTYISLYPKLNAYTTVDTIPDYGAPALNISDLKGLPTSVYKDKQVRYVESKRALYAFDQESTTADNGDNVLTPTGNPSTGRWLAMQSSVLPGSITLAMLDSSLQSSIGSDLSTSTTVLSISTTHVIDLNTAKEVSIVQTPVEDGNPTIINFTATLANNSSKMTVLELRQLTGVVQFHSSIAFPGGTTPLLSGQGKTDLFILIMTKDSTGTVKKRAFLSQKDIN